MQRCVVCQALELRRIAERGERLVHAGHVLREAAHAVRQKDEVVAGIAPGTRKVGDAAVTGTSLSGASASMPSKACSQVSTLLCGRTPSRRST